MEFYVGWFIEQSSGDILDQEVLKGLSDLQIDLALDLYHPFHMAQKRPR